LNSHLSNLLCIHIANGIEYCEAELLANRLKLSFFKEADRTLSDISEFPYVLSYTHNSLNIIQTTKGAPGPVNASFVGGKTAHRLNFGGGKGQMIAKAVGLNKGVQPTILDATAGLGRDAFVMASLGCDVLMLERSPVVSALLAFALEEAKSSVVFDIVSRMSLINENAIDWLDSQAESVADVIYLDPMYPHRDKSSLVKKEMRLFQDIVGEDMDDARLLEAALDKAAYRVVVKRPRKGDIIDGVQPSFQLLGKSCRYDLYTLKRIEDIKARI